MVIHLTGDGPIPAGGAHAEENKMNLTCDCGSDLFKVTDVSEVACAKCRKPAGYLTSQHPAIPLPVPGHSVAPITRCPRGRRRHSHTAATAISGSHSARSWTYTGLVGRPLPRRNVAGRR